MSRTSQPNLEEQFIAKMAEAGMPDAAIRSFTLHVRRYFEGETGELSRDRLEPIGPINDMRELADGPAAADEMLRRVVMIKLNGGLGTGMGLQRAKSLIEVRPGRSFLELIVRQILAHRLDQ